MEILIIITGIVLAVMLQAKIYKSRAFTNLQYSCYFDKEQVMEGEDITFTEEIKNSKWLPLPSFKSEITVSSALEFSEAEIVKTGSSAFVSSFFSVKGKSSITRKWTVKCTEPGIFSVESVTLSASDPLDFILVSEKAECSLPKITVLPKRYLFSFPYYQSCAVSGEQPIKNGLISDPFLPSGVREYDGSQSFKSINWKQSAKLDCLVTNVFDPSDETGIAVILHLEGFSNPKEKIHSLRTCAQLLYLAGNRKAQLIAGGEKEGEYLFVPASSGDKFQLDCRRILAAAASANPVPLSYGEKFIQPGFFRIIVTAQPDRIPDTFLREKCLIVQTGGQLTALPGADSIYIREDENGRTAP